MPRSRSYGFAFYPRDWNCRFNSAPRRISVRRRRSALGGPSVPSADFCGCGQSVSLRLVPLRGLDSPRGQTPPPVFLDGTQEPDPVGSPFRCRSGFSNHPFFRPLERVGNRFQALFTTRQGFFSPFAQTTVALSASESI